MKKTWMKFSTLALAVALLAPASLLAQKEEKDVKEEKDKKEKKDVRQVIVTTKGDKSEKIVVEVVGDKITINGKPYEEYAEKKDGDVSVRINKLKDLESLTFSRTPKGSTWSMSGDNLNLFKEDANRAMLGVTTEKNEDGDGVKVNDITKESAAAKAGLKEGDIIKKIDDTKIDDPDDLSKAIREHKPGDKVTVTYSRDKKDQKATAELTKWKGMTLLTGTNGDFNLNFNEMENFSRIMPKVAQGFPKTYAPNAQNWSWSGGSPKLGLSVQDTDEGKGVKVIDVDEESNSAKAGIKKDDVITEVDGKAVNSTDDMVKMVRESREKASLMIKLQRGGKAQSIEVKMPKRIKTADL